MLTDGEIMQQDGFYARIPLYIYSDNNFCDIFKTIDGVEHQYDIYMDSKGAPRGFGDLGRMAIYIQGSREHW